MSELLEQLINLNFCSICDTKQDMGLTVSGYGEFERYYYCKECKKWLVVTYSIERQEIYTSLWNY